MLGGMFVLFSFLFFYLQGGSYCKTDSDLGLENNPTAKALLRPTVGVRLPLVDRRLFL